MNLTIWSEWLAKHPDTTVFDLDTGAELCWDTFTELCVDQPGVIEQNCNDGIDNDGDGSTDCLAPFKDVDCDAFAAPNPTCFNERDTPGQGTHDNCTDGVDNNADGTHARIRDERQSGLDVEPATLGECALDQGDLRASHRLHLSLHGRQVALRAVIDVGR